MSRYVGEEVIRGNPRPLVKLLSLKCGNHGLALYSDYFTASRRQLANRIAVHTLMSTSSVGILSSKKSTGAGCWSWMQRADLRDQGVAVLRAEPDAPVHPVL
jgi:hypothetical protein